LFNRPRLTAGCSANGRRKKYILYELKFSIRKAGVFISYLSTKETGRKRIPPYTAVGLF